MKKVVIIISCILVLIVSFFLGYYFMYLNKENITVFLNGDNNITIDVFESYKENGITLKVNNNIVDNSKYLLTINNDINAGSLGNYQVNYEINYKKNIYKLKRNISVVDTKKPVITLSDDKITMDYCTKKVKNEITYNAVDNYDGDITQNVLIEENNNKRIYSVKDSSGNVDTKEINIIYEKKPSDKFYLKGNKKMNILLHSTFEDPGVVYSDGCGKTISTDIVVSGEVNTEEEGTYFITYSANGKTLTREVVVSEKNIQPKTIYLTFDDGPGAQTRKILDTLNKYGVKATFFVTHQFSSYMDLIGDEYTSGHTIAVHTYTHNYKTVYTTVDGYIDDFNRMNEVIKSYTGSYSNIFRFPGGSSNTVSRQYGKGIVSAIAAEMTSRGYAYFDWNVDSKDAAGANQQRVYNEVVNGVERCSTCVVLMHDIKVSTANALDDILATLTSKGYTFKTLNVHSPAIRHSINN